MIDLTYTLKVSQGLLDLMIRGLQKLPYEESAQTITELLSLQTQKHQELQKALNTQEQQEMTVSPKD